MISPFIPGIRSEFDEVCIERFSVINLQVLQGKAAGLNYQTGRFPLRVGRAADDDLRLPDLGVWDHHITITLRDEGYHYQVPESALLLVNSERSDSGRLRNGDLLELGSAKLRFWLAAAHQPGLAIREGMAWLFMVALTAFQLWLLLKWLPTPQAF